MVDDKDKLLLTLLTRDARRPIVALARDLGLSRSATQERLAKLQASGAITASTLAERSAVRGRESARLMVRFAPGQRRADVVPKLKRIPTVHATHSSSGATPLILRHNRQDVAE